MCQLDVACFFRNHANFLSSGFKISCSLTINFLVLRLLIDWRIFFCIGKRLVSCHKNLIMQEEHREESRKLLASATERPLSLVLRVQDPVRGTGQSA